MHRTLITAALAFVASISTASAAPEISRERLVACVGLQSALIDGYRQRGNVDRAERAVETLALIRDLAAKITTVDAAFDADAAIYHAGNVPDGRYASVGELGLKVFDECLGPLDERYYEARPW